MNHAYLILAAALAFPVRALPAVDFNREIRPILSDNCFKCHGPDDKHRMANLRLDIRDGGAFAQRAKARSSCPAMRRRASSINASAIPTRTAACRRPTPN